MVVAGTVLRQGGHFSAPRNAREVVIFLSFLVVGMAPPFSSFLVAVLKEFAIHLVHLTPNAVLTLLLFAHACEMFVVVRPSVELFWHFFAPCRSGSLSPSFGTARQSRQSSSGGTALVSFPLLDRISGRTGNGIGCTSRWTTLPLFFVFLKALRRETPGGPKRRRWVRCGRRCWRDSSCSGAMASRPPRSPSTSSTIVCLHCRPILTCHGCTPVTGPWPGGWTRSWERKIPPSPSSLGGHALVQRSGGGGDRQSAPGNRCAGSDLTSSSSSRWRRW